MKIHTIQTSDTHFHCWSCSETGECWIWHSWWLKSLRFRTLQWITTQRSCHWIRSRYLQTNKRVWNFSLHGARSWNGTSVQSDSRCLLFRDFGILCKFKQIFENNGFKFRSIKWRLLEFIGTNHFPIITQHHRFVTWNCHSRVSIISKSEITCTKGRKFDQRLINYTPID